MDHKFTTIQSISSPSTIGWKKDREKKKEIEKIAKGGSLFESYISKFRFEFYAAEREREREKERTIGRVVIVLLGLGL